MPIYMKGNMWDVADEIDHFVITTNAIVKDNGGLVMGAGIAKQVRDREPGIDKKCGAAVNKNRYPDGQYGFVNAVGKLWMFQVKHHFKDQADLNLIQYSTHMMDNHARMRPDMTYALNFPGIGNGRQSYDAVKPIIDILPNNVQVWTFN